MPDNSNRLVELFSTLSELAASERRARIEQLRSELPELAAELQSLLDAQDEAGDYLQDLDAVRASELLQLEDIPAPPERAGPWRLIRELGRGGLGVVYLGERDQGDFEQRVAVKLTKRGLDTELILRRFHVERRILATLQHPNIARLFDGGMLEDGRPYFAMEYIEGLPITAWCDQHKSDIAQRLRLFEQVCRAVQYAHARLIVHRDLKPANILVTDEGTCDGSPEGLPEHGARNRPTGGAAVVKLLDFGIAKLLTDDVEDGAALTVVGMHAMTPEYAAPEQVRGEPVSAATDVYALGVVLYELLAGQHPFSEGGITRDKLVKAICDTAPTLPSAAIAGERAEEVAKARSSRPKALKRLLHGDLDNIVLKAIAKEPGRRYGSAEALAEDVRRHLDDLPVKARRETFAYRASRFVSRHRAGVAATAAVILALAGGLAVALWQAQVARQQAHLAGLEAQRSERSLEFLTGLFQHGDPRRGTQVESIAALLAAGTQRARSDLAEDPALQGSVLLRLAEVYLGRAQFAEARALADHALELLESALEENDRRIADAYRVAGGARYRIGQDQAAESLLREAAARYRQLGDPGKEAEALGGVAGILRQTQNFGEALALQKQVVAEVNAQLGSGSYETAAARFALGVFAVDAGDYTLAESELRTAIKSMESLGPKAEVDLASALLTLAGLLDRLGQSDGAGVLFERGIEANIRIFGENSDPVAKAQFGHGIFLLGQNRPEAAEANFRFVLANSETTPTTQAHSHRYLGRALRDQRRLEEAIDAFDAAEDAYLKLGGTSSTEQAHRSAADRGHATALDGNPGMAVEVITTAVAGIEAIRGDSHYNLIQPLINLSEAQQAVGDLLAARVTAERALAMAEAILGPEHRFTAEARAQRDELQTRPGSSSR